jgi:mevalonate pyrophosphate decarboxylase
MEQTRSSSPYYFSWLKESAALPATVAVIHACGALRAAGIGAWETIDAGPQVKILCLAADADAVIARVGSLGGGIQTILCRPGPGLQYGPCFA